MSDQPDPARHTGPTADEIAGLVSAERTAGEYVPVPTSWHRGGRRRGAALPKPPVAWTSATSGRRPSRRTRPTFVPARACIPTASRCCRSSASGAAPGCSGTTPAPRTPQFGQQITISHDGRPFLRYESISWLLDPDGTVAGPAGRELGFWRPQPDGSIEFLVAHSEGRIEVFYGQPRSVASWALSTDVGWRTPTAPPVVGTTRLYGITPDGRLAYVEERAHSDVELAPHASAALDRVAG